MTLITQRIFELTYYELDYYWLLQLCISSHFKLTCIVLKDTFLRSSQGDCLKNEGNGVDMMPVDNSINPLSYDEQCEFAYGNGFTKYNGQYQGKI